MRQTKAALRWIVGILDELHIPYEVDGGLAAELYGSVRELADIDINVPAERFDEIVPRVEEYVRFGPAWYEDEHWRCYMMSLKVDGQNIDIGALGKMQYFDKETGEWVQLPTDLSQLTRRTYLDMELPLIDEATLIAYKEKIGRGVDRKDVRAMEGR